jgi:hypothetical protein
MYKKKLGSVAFNWLQYCSRQRTEAGKLRRIVPRFPLYVLFFYDYKLHTVGLYQLCGVL